MLLQGAPPPEGLYIETEWERLDRGGLERLKAWLDEHPDTRLVVIDVWTRIRPFASNHSDRYQTDYEAANLVQSLAVHRGVAVVALYHTRKAESSDFVETVQGSFGTAGAADTVIVIKRSRGKADATLHVTGRDVEEQELALEFASETGSWSLLGDAAEHGLAETRREIRQLVEAHGDLTPKQVSELAAITYENAKKTMQRMFYDGQLTANRGKYSIPSQTTVPAVPESLLPANEGFSSGTADKQVSPKLGDTLEAGVPKKSADFQEKGTEGHRGQGSEGGNGRVPTWGDSGYLDYVTAVHHNGHITTGEALELEQLHELLLEARGEAS
jgi:hypothetical protein